MATRAAAAVGNHTTVAAATAARREHVKNPEGRQSRGCLGPRQRVRRHRREELPCPEADPKEGGADAQQEGDAAQRGGARPNAPAQAAQGQADRDADGRPHRTGPKEDRQAVAAAREWGAGKRPAGTEDTQRRRSKAARKSPADFGGAASAAAFVM